MKTWKSSSRVMGIVLAVMACVGLMASFVLTYETLEVAKNPSHVPSCNISPLVSCSSVMSEPSSEVFGLPFSVFGIAAFGALLAFSVLMIVGTKFAALIWKAAIGASLAGMAAVIYMICLSIFSYGTICPWCFVTWIVTIVIFWSVMTYVAAARPIKLKGRADACSKFWDKNAPMILASIIVALVFILVFRFRESLL